MFIIDAFFLQIFWLHLWTKDGAAVVASKLRGGHLPLVHVPGRNHGVAGGRDEFDPPNEWLIDIIVVNGVW